MNRAELAKLRKRLTQYTIDPRYSREDSQCHGRNVHWVDEPMATYVAQIEVEAYKDALEGYCGRRWQLLALTVGLRGIVEQRTLERRPGAEPDYCRNGWRVTDGCTGEQYWRPIDQTRVGVAVGDDPYQAVHVFQHGSLVLAAKGVEQLNPPFASLYVRPYRIGQWYDGQWHHLINNERLRYLVNFRPAFEARPNPIGSSVWSLDVARVFRGKRVVYD